MSRILYQSMLKASSRPEEWPAVLASELDGSQCSAHALVRAPRSTPEGVKWLQHIACFIIEGAGRQPATIRSYIESRGGVGDGFVGGDVLWAPGIKIADDSNLQWPVHSVCLLRATILRIASVQGRPLLLGLGGPEICVLAFDPILPRRGKDIVGNQVLDGFR